MAKGSHKAAAKATGKKADGKAKKAKRGCQSCVADEKSRRKVRVPQKYLDKIKQEVVDAQTLGVNATPAFFVNGRFISGAQPYNFFASYIDTELGKLAESPITSPPVASS